jgi:molybdopterin synthase sulfur carrier subunit
VNVEIIFFGQLRELAAARQVTFVISDGARLADLMKHLGEEYGDAFRRELSNTRHLQILINGQRHNFLGGMETPLNDGDTVVLLPPIFGG